VTTVVNAVLLLHKFKNGNYSITAAAVAACCTWQVGNIIP